MIHKKDKPTLKYLKKNWHIFPVNTIYPTASDGRLILDFQKSVFIYSINKIKDPICKVVETNSVFFRVYRLGVLGLHEPAGFAFVPIIPKTHKLRYTPTVLTITGPNSTKEKVLNAERKIIFDSEWIQVIWLSCGTEIVTDLGNKLGIYLLED